MLADSRFKCYLGVKVWYAANKNPLPLTILSCIEHVLFARALFDKSIYLTNNLLWLKYKLTILLSEENPYVCTSVDK